MKKLNAIRCCEHGPTQSRKGAVMVFAAAMLIVVIAFAAFTVDFGMVTLTKGQMQNAADSAAHAAVLEVSRAYGPGAEMTQSQAENIARQRAVEMVSRFRTGDVESTVADEVRDVRVGRRSWDDAAQEWVQEWGVSPYNMVEVTVRRTNAETTSLPMTFARILGRDNFELTTTSVAAMYPGVGFVLNPNPDPPPHSDPPNDCIDILPIALDLESWTNLLDQHYHGTNHGYDDDYSWSNSNGVNHCRGDGIPEINIYPDLNSGLAPGNRGTVDLGSANNSTNDIKRQIIHGLNAYDMSFFPNNRIEFDANGALYLNGDTGISAGIEDALQSIIGQVRAIPIFIEVTGQGNNATYTIVKFVGIRIIDVKLSGGPNKRHLTVQPAVFSDSHVLRGNVDVNVDSILSQPVVIH
ncbi:MAG: pilus assembly protein TadG-related protein [Planctomycetaceae bacterium]